MDNRAQVSLEYMIIISVLLVLSAITAVVALGFFPLKESLRSSGIELKDKAIGMLDG